MTTRKQAAPANRGSAPLPEHAAQAERMMARGQAVDAKRGGDSPSPEYLAERYERLDLRLGKGAVSLLRAESERSGYSMAQLVEEMIRIELDPSHEGYVGPRKAVRCSAYFQRVRCDRIAGYGYTGDLCERCWMLRLDETLDRSDDD